MHDPDSEMHAYIDKYIVGDRTSDAADDSSGAAWAAYERGEFDVPDWFSEEYRRRDQGSLQKWVSGKWKTATYTDDFTFGSFIKSLFRLLAVVLLLSLVIVLITRIALST